ncbi:MAG TPA: hypothetical protein VGJ84_10955 [Polyangiaceae bacterium]
MLFTKRDDAVAHKNPADTGAHEPQVALRFGRAGAHLTPGAVKAGFH